MSRLLGGRGAKLSLMWNGRSFCVFDDVGGQRPAEYFGSCFSASIVSSRVSYRALLVGLCRVIYVGLR
jgi:hypothetical protein